MLKKFTLLFALVTVAFLGSVKAQGKFAKVFPDTNLSWNTGMNNTIAVDPTGKVWMAPYVNKSDSIQNSAGTYVGTAELDVFNPDGSLYKKYQYFSYNASVDTFFSPSTGYGMTNDAEGNIIMLKGSDVLRKINYQTGEETAMATDPLPGYVSSLTSPQVDAADEVFITTVVPTAGVGPAVLSSDFSTILIAIDTSMYGAYSRNMSVTADGNDVWVHHIGLGSFHYHSDNGTLGPYVMDPDTAFKDLVIESSAWQPKTGWLWVSSGNVTSGMPNPPYSGYAWYGFDMTNPSSPVLKDSVLWEPNTGLAGDLISADPRPRGIAFSPTGDTVYVAAFGPGKGFVEMFTGLVTTGISTLPKAIPESYSLSQNYPNPFNPTTKIDYALKATGKVSVVVYDLLGREVARLVDGVQAAGQHSVTFNASNLASGVYIYSLTTSDGFKMAKKMILMK